METFYDLWKCEQKLWTFWGSVEIHIKTLSKQVKNILRPPEDSYLIVLSIHYIKLFDTLGRSIGCLDTLNSKIVSIISVFRHSDRMVRKKWEAGVGAGGKHFYRRG